MQSKKRFFRDFRGKKLGDSATGNRSIANSGAWPLSKLSRRARIYPKPHAKCATRPVAHLPVPGTARQTGKVRQGGWYSCGALIPLSAKSLPRQGGVLPLRKGDWGGRASVGGRCNPPFVKGVTHAACVGGFRVCRLPHHTPNLRLCPTTKRIVLFHSFDTQ